MDKSFFASYLEELILPNSISLETFNDKELQLNDFVMLRDIMAPRKYVQSNYRIIDYRASIHTSTFSRVISDVLSHLITFILGIESLKS